MSRLKRNYAYDVGYTASALPNYTLTCTKAGVTSSDPITVQEGTIIDGTCEWNCVNNVGGGGGGGVVEDWEVGKTYKVNQLVKSDNKLYICMNEHTSSEAFATDLLAGNWAFIGGAGYSNVIMDTIYEGDVQVTATTEVTYTLTSSADNYDYAICTVKITYTDGLNSRATTVVPANQSSSMGWTYGVGAPSASRAYGWIGFTTDKTSIRFGLWEKGSRASSVSLERVDAIKVNTMTLSEIA